MTTVKPVIYGRKTSPPVNSVLLTLKALNVDYEFRIVRPGHHEQLTADFLKKNPTHTVPTLEDVPGQYIGDSHAIMAYLVGKYGKDDTLYPKDLYLRAKVDELLHFDNASLFTTCVKQTLGPIFAGIRNDVPAEKIAKINKTYEMLQRFLGEHRFVAGDTMTIADFSCFTSIRSMGIIVPINEENYPKIFAWINRMHQLPYIEEIVENQSWREAGVSLANKLSKL